MKKHILIIYTGGTIGMKNTSDGYAPVAGFLRDSIQMMPEFYHDDMPNFTLLEYQDLIDSANVAIRHWMKIAADIKSEFHNYDGFVVLHGTDTMTYTASALSFIFDNLSKPVIITGSQIPLSELRSDGRINLLNSLYIAAHYPMAEVSVFFNNQLLRGNRTSKIHADGFNAFSSPNYPTLLEAGIEIKAHAGKQQLPVNRPLLINEISSQPISVVYLFPGVSEQVIKTQLNSPCKAGVLLTYGVGNAPQTDSLLAIFKAATARGVVLVNCSQCLSGSVNMDGYATGHALAGTGVISGFDMTTEAVISKLHYLLSQNLEKNIIEELLQTNLRGELTAQ